MFGLPLVKQPLTEAVRGIGLLRGKVINRGIRSRLTETFLGLPKLYSENRIHTSALPDIRKKLNIVAEATKKQIRWLHGETGKYLDTASR